ncbi:hypothetical protein BTR23_14475 [Alkalihalophilus pseudofirmus]|nr:hypothetical protein BTR23_14475 [Alkalihalophilus pseudofirmus]
MARANVKEKVEEKTAELLKLSLEFSKEYLNQEYDDVIQKLINKMARKREVPFVSGRIEIWAAAVIHALGTINFLFDKSSQPYVSATDIFDYFGTKQSTTSQKSKKIRDMFKMSYFDSNFSIQSVDQDNPFNQLSLVNGLIVPQDMLEEEEVEIEEWEVLAAEILGVTKFERGKKYKESLLFKSLNVNEKSLIRFYDYLMKLVKFPFSGLYEEEIGPLEVAEFEVSCIGLDQEMKVDEFYGILVECRHGRKKVILPLASISIEEGHMNFNWIELYHNWFWSYR